MRQPKRIPLFLKLINIRLFCEENRIKPMDRIPDRVKYYWKKNPNRRFGEVLRNLEYASPHSDIYLLDDDEILLNQGVPPEEFMFWGQMYDSDGKCLERPRYILIKDMNTGHIKKIFAQFSTRIFPIHETAFRNVLGKRSGNKASP